MKSQVRDVSLVIASVSLAAEMVFGQGTFQNLDFEFARVPDVPAGQDGGVVSPADAIPGWTAYWGTLQSGVVYHNTILLGGPAVSLWGPIMPQSVMIQGKYFASLLSGASPTFPNNTSAIGQVGQIPITAQSLMFSARVASLHVTFGGSLIPISLIGSTPNYDIYGGDVRAFAGLTGELRFTGYPLSPSGFGGAALDAIAFSDLPVVPEPCTLGLTMLGALLFACCRRRPAARQE